MDNQTAMRDSNGNVVFVNQYGEYVDTFPEDQIVQRNIEHSHEFTVYFIVDNDNDYVVFERSFNDKQNALDFATNVYGTNVTIGELEDKEVFEVEVHNN